MPISLGLQMALRKTISHLDPQPILDSLDKPLEFNDVEASLSLQIIGFSLIGNELKISLMYAEDGPHNITVWLHEQRPYIRVWDKANDTFTNVYLFPIA